MTAPMHALGGASAWELAALTWLALLAVPLAVIDVRSRRLPDRLTIPAFAGVVALLGAGAAANHRPGDIGQAILGAAALAGFYLALMVIRPGGMYLGDVKLAASIGAALAWAGWQALLTGTFLAFALAALYSLALMAMGRANRKSQVPFGPFLRHDRGPHAWRAAASATRGRPGRPGATWPRWRYGHGSRLSRLSHGGAP